MRFQRAPNQLYKSDLIERIQARFPTANNTLLKKLGLVELLERAVAADLLTADEIRASIPERTHTVKTYLSTFVKDVDILNRIKNYVVSWSLMWSYGSRLLNRGAIYVLGGRSNEGPVQRFDATISDETQQFFDFISRDTYKHMFLPEAWGVAHDEAGTDSDDDEVATQHATLDPMVAEFVQLFGENLSHLTQHDWRGTLSGTAKWKSNAVNRMKQQYDVNVQNHVLVHLRRRALKYITSVVASEDEHGVKDLLTYGIRPLVMDNDTFSLAMDIRQVLMPRSSNFASGRVPDRPPDLTVECFNLHVFLALQPGGHKATSYFPVGQLSRKHAYIDTTIAKVLLPKAYKDRLIATDLNAWKQRSDAIAEAWDAQHPDPCTKSQLAKWTRERKKHVDSHNPATKDERARLADTYDEGHEGIAAHKAYAATRKTELKALQTAFLRVDPKPRTADLGFARLLGLDPESFKRSKKEARRKLRLRVRAKLKRCTGSGELHRKLRAKYRASLRVGHGALPVGQVCTSITTDGVALEMIFTAPAFDPNEFTRRCREDASAIITRLEARNPAKRSEPTPEEMQRDYPNPEFVAEDRGRAKLSTVAGAPNGATKPETRIVFTRTAYYNDIQHKRRQKEELARRERLGLTQVYTALGDGAGHKTTCADMWDRYLEVERDNAPLLIRSGIEESWLAHTSMLSYRLCRSSKDRFARKLVTQGDMARPLVIGTGDAKFASTGKGEMAVPTSALELAVERMVRRLKASRSILRLVIDEFRTTYCNPETMLPTTGKLVNNWTKDEFGNKHLSGQRSSRRLRVCKDNTLAPGQDRDVMAARNILLLTIYKYYGIERPWALSRTTSNAALSLGLTNYINA